MAAAQVDEPQDLEEWVFMKVKSITGTTDLASLFLELPSTELRNAGVKTCALPVL